MHFWKDKEGNELTRKEFMDRWKQGIQSVTPLQQIKFQIRSTILILIGLVSGIILTIINIKILWWVLIILVGVFGITSTQFLGLLQKKKALEDIELMMKKEVEKND